MESKSEHLSLIEKLIDTIVNTELEKLPGEQIRLFLDYLIDVQNFLNRKIITVEKSIAFDALPSRPPIITDPIVEDLILTIYELEIKKITQEEKLAFLKSLMSLQEFINKIAIVYEEIAISNQEETNTKKITSYLKQLKKKVANLPTFKNYSFQNLKTLQEDILAIQEVSLEILLEIQLLTPFGPVRQKQSAPIPGVELQRLSTPKLFLDPSFSFPPSMQRPLFDRPAFAKLTVGVRQKSSSFITFLQAAAIVMKNLFIENNVNKGYYQADTVPVENMHIPLLPSNELLTPIATSFYDKTNDILLVEATVFVNSELRLAQGDFNVFSNYVLSEIGEPQLNIYITYDRASITTKTYSIIPFAIGYDSHSVVTESDRTIVELGRIKSVNVFLVNEDPRTSRGTTTIVQNQTTGI